MHKKSSKHSKRESPQKSSSTTRKPQVKSKKETECSAIDLKVPQNSKCELSRFLRDAENKENRRVRYKHDEKHKHKKHESKKDEERQEHHKKKHEHSRDKHSKHSKTEPVQPVQSEHSPKRKKSARKEKHEEKVKPSDKRPEELNKSEIKMRHRSRSFSIESSEHILKRKEKHIRREKTFHMEDLKKLRQTKSSLTPPDGKETGKTKEKSEKKKHRHKDRQKDAVEEKHEEGRFEAPQLMYCHINTHNPFKKCRKRHRIDELYKNQKEKSSNKPKQTSSRDMYECAPFCEGQGRNPSLDMSFRRSKEKKLSEQIKYSPRKSKIKEHVKSMRDQRSRGSLGPYNKYFRFENRSETDNTARQGIESRRRRTNREDNEKIPMENDEDTAEAKRENKKTIKQRQEENLVEKKEELREKIEDDLKSYFTKIQCLIDKKLEYILHSANKEEKIVTKEEGEALLQGREEERTHRSQSRKEKRLEKQFEKEQKIRSHRSRALEKQRELRNIETEMAHRRNKTPRRSDKSKIPIPLIDSVEGEDNHRPQRHKSPKQDGFDKKQSIDTILDMNHVPKLIEEDEHKYRPRSSRSPQIPQRERSPNKNVEEVYSRIPNDVMVDLIEPEKLVDNHHGRSNKIRSRNLECKTISIVGIPSQIKDPSTIFSQAQTCTSINNLEDTMERKKQSKRFKLYYKYSVADNKCPGSGHSSDRKSVVSDSYKILSDHSIDRESVYLDDLDLREEEPTKDSQKVIVVMKKERYMRNCYPENLNELGDQKPKKHRKQIMPPDISKLNNILEETSDISMHGRKMRSANQAKRDYFDLNTSSSDCNLETKKKPTYSDWNIRSSKFGYVSSSRYETEKMATAKPRAKMRSPEREAFFGEKKERARERRMEKTKMVEVDLSNHKFRRVPRDFGKKYTSKSDIDISYDSLHKGRSRKASPNRGNRAPQYRTEDRRYSREKSSPKSVSRRSPRERSIPRKLTRRLPEPLKDEPKRILTDEPQPLENRLTVEKDSDATKHQAIRESTPTEVSRISSCTNRRNAEKNSSRLQFPQVTSSHSQNIKRAHTPEKVVRNCSCQFKELVDVGVEVKLKEEDMEVPEKKTFPKTAEVAVEAKIVRKQFPIYRREKTAKTLPKPLPKTSEVAVEANLLYQTDRQESPEKKIPPLHPTNPGRALSPKKRPIYNRQRSELVRVKPLPEHVNKPAVRPPTIRPLLRNTEKVSNEEKETPTKKYILIHSRQNLKQNLETAVPDEDKLTTESPKREEISIRSSKSAVNIRELSPKRISSERNSSNFLDKFSDIPLKGNSQFLDACAVKSIISDNPHASRLFLTKDFSREINSYQRRKMYDEAIRQKLKKRIQNKPQQVFEVRYLTLQQDPKKQQAKLSHEVTTKPSQHRAKMPSFPCNRSSKVFCKKKNNLKVTPKKSLKMLNKKRSVNNSDSKSRLSVSSCRNPYGTMINDVDLLTKFRKKKFPDNSVQEIFKGRQLNDKSVSNMLNCCKQLADIQSSSLLLNRSGNSLDKQSSETNTGSKLANNEEFMKLIGCLCKTVVKYCKSNILSSQEESQNSPRVSEGSETDLKNAETHETKADGDKVTDDQQKQESVPQPDDESGRNHASCPALANTPPSFEFLYEEESEYSKETILANLSKPVETILGYALSDNPPLIPPDTFTATNKKIDQISNSPTESGESGYSSNSSKKVASVTNFFKRPNIAALFKPMPSLRPDVNTRLSKVSLVHVTSSNTDYSFMTQQCQEYAQKVRIQSETPTKEEPFQEISLDELLGKKNEGFNSNCSLCRELTMSGHDVKNESIPSLDDIFSDDSLVQSDNELETLIYYGSKECNPSLEIVKVKRMQPMRSTIDICRSQRMLDSEVVLSSTNLNSCSLTFIETGGQGCGDYLIDYEKLSEISRKKHDELRSVFHRSKSNLSNIVSSTLISGGEKSECSLTDSELTLPLATSKSCNWTPSLANNSDIRKSLAKKFFDNLIQVYDKEVMVTKKLFQDDDFFANHLMSLLDDGHKTARGRGRRKLKNIGGKLRNCIDKVFSAKVDDGSINEEEAVKALTQKFERAHQENLKILAYNARRYFSLFVQAVRINKDINDEMKIFGLQKLLEKIESGDFAVLRKEESVNFEDEIRQQVKEGFLKVYKISVKEAKKCKRALTEIDLHLIRAFICKYRIGLLSKTDLIATYIGRGFFQTESQLRAAVTYLIRSQTREIDIKDFEEHCMYKL